jgi:uncharacterized membrane protein YciS (DUF1049 family)
VVSVFGPVRFLLPVCRLSWFLYTLNIYAGVSSSCLFFILFHVYFVLFQDYCSILYLKPRMKIVLRGRKVKTKLIQKCLSQTETDTYRPTWAVSLISYFIIKRQISETRFTYISPVTITTGSHIY